MIAATWNVDLAKDFGRSIGQMADEMDVSGWYAPAMNIHRTAFAGRNFEYYSEDGFISGKMAANVILAAVILLLALWEFLLIKNYLKQKKNAA